MKKLGEPDKETYFSTTGGLHTSFERTYIDILDEVFCSVEAWFHVNGFVNSQNSNMWSTLHFKHHCRNSSQS
jgi:hypothetical protein